MWQKWGFLVEDQKVGANAAKNLGGANYFSRGPMGKLGCPLDVFWGFDLTGG